MIGLKAEIPDKCIYCPVRWSCDRYHDWLYDNNFSSPPTPVPGTDECILVELDGDMEE